MGTFNPDVAQDSCGVCAPGQYANTPGSKSCKTCPAGTFSGAQASTCRACNSGFFAPSGSGACSPCKPGTFASATRSGTCQACPRGFQCPTNAMSKPSMCPRGYFSNKDGVKLCTPCPVNTYSSVVPSQSSPLAVSTCAACSQGTSTRGLTGQSLCQDLRPQAAGRLKTPPPLPRPPSPSPPAPPRPTPPPPVGIGRSQHFSSSVCAVFECRRSSPHDP